MSDEQARVRWRALYLDGESAQARSISVRILPEGLRLLVSETKTEQWPYDQVRQTQGWHRGEHVRLERIGVEPAPAIEVADPAFLAAMRAIAPDARVSVPLQPGMYAGWIVGSIIGLVALIGGIHTWGIPALASAVAQHVPVSWEEHLGASVAADMAPEATRLKDPDLQKAVEGILARLAAARPSPYRFRLAITRNEDVNAFAAPGGYVVVFTGLLAKTRRPEELAGVLAHEMQHVQRRHTTKGLLRQASTQLLLTALTGDTGQTSQALGMAGMLGTLGYARQDEAEADREGMRMLMDAHIDATGMVDMFKTLETVTQDDGRFQRGLTFLSTHPNTRDRLQVLARMARTQDGETVPLMAPERWQMLVREALKQPGRHMLAP